MERSREVKYQTPEIGTSADSNELETRKVCDSSNSRSTDRGKPVIYLSDPIHLAAHKDYQKWLKLPGGLREEFGIVGDPLSHFFKIHENKKKTQS